MNTTGFDFDQLGDRLGVADDDTQDIDQSAPLRRPVGEILQRPQPVRSAPTAPSTHLAAKPASRRPPSEPGTRRSSDRRERGERSSANLPIGLVEQLARYKRRHRWELSQLIESALEHLDLDVVRDPDGVLNAQWHGPRTARHYQLQRRVFERLDTVGARWRMNRSQVITVLVVLEAQRLGLTDDR